MLKSLHIYIVIACGFLFSCQDNKKLSDTTGRVNPSVIQPTTNVDSSPTPDSGNSNSLGKIVVSCDDTQNNKIYAFNSGANSVQVELEVSCFKSKTEQVSATRFMDMLFVLDVTGSMLKSLAEVKKGIELLINIAVDKGWKLRVGALGFADTIIAEIPLDKDINKLLLAMNSNKSIWEPSLGVGGENNEIGLAAMESAMNILLNSNVDEESPREKMIIYSSDAPAQRVLKAIGGYETATSTAKLQEFVQKISENKDFARIFYSVGNTTFGLEPGMPNPRTQFEEFLGTGIISSYSIDFPFKLASFQSGVLDRLGEGRAYLESCKTSEIRLAAENKPNTILALSKVNSSNNSASVVTMQPQKNLLAGNYFLNVIYTCVHGSEAKKINFSIK